MECNPAMNYTKKELINSPAGSHWHKICIKNHHGIVVPLFSLHSVSSCGIGEFHDLIPMISWCEDIGFDTIQLLPLNDSWTDSSPYNAISAFALNPVYLSISKLPNVKDSEFAHLRNNITSKRIDYKTVRNKKMTFLKGYYAREKNNNSDDYNNFIEKHRHWLEPYALFSANKTPPSPVSLKTYECEVDFHIFIQYHCFQQLKYIKGFATSHKIILKGDIPILINKDSADVWSLQSLFNATYSAGAPPDMYNAEGQKWGFPIYNWTERESDCCKWWKDRLAVASNFYHIYRLDHIVGFFRIWAIPEGKTSKEGFFIPEDHNVWIEYGKKILTMMLESCSMLPIGEDLGMVPQEIRRCLQNLGIPGTKVMRWERRWHEGEDFIPLGEYMPISMTTVSTHDSRTLTLWWRDCPEEAERYASAKGWKCHPKISQKQHYEIIKDSHNTSSLFHINPLNEYLAMIPEFVHDSPDEERINTPGTISHENWSYRFIPSVEEISSNDELKSLMRKLIS